MSVQLELNEAYPTIDKLSIIASSNSLFHEVLGRSLFVKETYQAKIPYRYLYTCVDGTTTIQVKDRNEWFNSDVRIEFNPNKAMYEGLAPLLEQLKFEKITRLDIAVDYFGQDLAGLMWVDSKHRKTVTYRSGTNALETLYIGSGSSDTSYRIYDKAKERGQDYKGHWWRVEAQLRPKDMKGYSIRSILALEAFKEIQGIYPNVADSLPVKQRALLYYLMHNPQGWAELDPHTRTKYRRLVAEHSRKLDPQPYEVAKRKVAQLLEQLDYWLRNMKF